MTKIINVCKMRVLLLFPDKGLIPISEKYIHNVVDTKNDNDFEARNIL